MKLNDRYIFAGLAIRKEKKSRSKSKREIAVDDKDFENESIEGSGGWGGFENQGQIIREMQFSPRRIFFFFFWDCWVVEHVHVCVHPRHEFAWL